MSLKHHFDIKLTIYCFYGVHVFTLAMHPRPLKEIYFNSGKLESTNRGYSTAKIAGIEYCWAYNWQYNTQYLYAMPTNIFDDFENGHVLASLISRIQGLKYKKDPVLYYEVMGKQDENSYIQITLQRLVAILLISLIILLNLCLDKMISRPSLI